MKLRKHDILTIPNFISVFRMFLIPFSYVFLTVIIEKSSIPN